MQMKAANSLIRKKKEITGYKIQLTTISNSRLITAKDKALQLESGGKSSLIFFSSSTEFGGRHFCFFSKNIIESCF
jgi:TRAP-type C4-dicarboxylate transport system substrate-binding protein